MRSGDRHLATQVPLIRCTGTRRDGRPCLNVLGQGNAALARIRYKGRAITCVVRDITCEECGATWVSPTLELEPHHVLPGRAA